MNFDNHTFAISYSPTTKHNYAIDSNSFKNNQKNHVFFFFFCYCKKEGYKKNECFKLHGYP